VSKWRGRRDGRRTRHGEEERAAFGPTHRLTLTHLFSLFRHVNLALVDLGLDLAGILAVHGAADGDAGAQDLFDLLVGESR
jgi:hypothetical protein